MKYKDVIKFFFDVETTGVDPKKHAIHQLAGLVEVNDEVVEEFDLRMSPPAKAQITEKALEIGGVTEKQIRGYPSYERGHRSFSNLAEKYVDKYDKKDKIYLVGYNNRAFDDQFARMLFLLNQDDYFNSLFWVDTLDAMVTASEYLIDRRREMANFQLGTVAQELGLDVTIDKLHDAFYDVELTRGIYRISTGRETEL